jgi:hypothetical protein
LEKNLSQLKMTTKVRHTCSLIVLVARAGWTQQREGVDLIQPCSQAQGKFAQMTQDLAITDYLFSRNMNH